MTKLLPLGSIVLLERGVMKIMVIGRLQINKSDNHLYDYVGCPYPDGLMGNEKVFLFNHDDINVTCFTGYDNEEEAEYQLRIQEYLEQNEVG